MPPIKPKPGWEFFCEHANECPNVCPCQARCGCKYYGCETRSRAPEREPAAPRDPRKVPPATPVVSARRKAPSRPTARRGDPNQIERRKDLSSRAVRPAVGAEGAAQKAVRLAFYAGWTAGFINGESSYRAWHPTPELAWAEFLKHGE